MAEPQNLAGEMRPTAATERIDLVDVLRGFAVFGILVANMASYSGLPGGYASWTQPLDRVVFLLTRLLIEAKFYSLFSFLFGWGMAVQMRRADARHSAFLPFYLRRLLALLLFGIIHATLIWTGDILTLYASLGFLLLLLRKRSVRFLLWASLASLLVAVLFTLPWGPVEAFRQAYFDLTAPLVLNHYGSGLYAEGGFLEITRLRVQDALAGQVYVFFALGNVFAMFLLGLAAGKLRLFATIDSLRKRLRRLLPALLGVGLLLNGLFVSVIVWPELYPATSQYPVRVAARTFGAPLLMLGYIGVIALLYQRPAWKRRLDVLAPVGRMALSNYILQSLIATAIFYSYGLGLYGRATPAGALLLTLLIYTAQVKLSGWWLERFRFGPLEWCWRLLTYGEPPMLRRRYPFEPLPAPSPAGEPHRRRRRTLVLVAGLLLAWGIGLAVWARSLAAVRVDPKVFFNAIQPVQVDAAADDEPGEGLPAAGDEAAAAPIESGLVERIPGPLVAEDDLNALALTFDVDAALAQVGALTQPDFAGRLAGSQGGYAAGDYLAKRFEELGLLPAGEDGTYFQPFDIPYTALAEVPRLSVSATGEPAQGFVFNRDFTVISNDYAGQGIADARVVWVDRCTADDFIEIDAVGAVAFCRQDTGVNAARNALEFGASGVLILVGRDSRPFDFGFPRFPAIVPEPLPVIAVGQRVAEALVAGSGFSWQDLELSAPPQELASRARLQVELAGSEACAATGCQGRNVLGLLPGRDPRYAGEVLVIGGHYDHMGSTPDGTVWWGANDDASGVAVMLEIARSWQEQGFVPRRSVLFAAWDAEELGLLGSKAFVEAPTIPADSIYSELQLDMVGAGGQLLEIAGSGRLVPVLEQVAGDLGIETERSLGGGSDHQSFLHAGFQAAMLIWRDLEGTYSDYHRPLDTTGRLDRTLLQQAGYVADLGVLSLVEGAPQIQDLLDERAGALLRADEQAFLATGDPQRAALDRLWFASAEQVVPVEVNLDLLSLVVQGDLAHGSVQIELFYPREDDPERTHRVSEGVSVQFRRVGGAWRWAGPDLVEQPLDGLPSPQRELAEALGLQVLVPRGSQADVAGVVGPGLEALQSASEQLGMRVPGGLRIELMENGGDIGIFSEPGADRRLTAWSGPGVLRMILPDDSAPGSDMAQELLQWLLASSGVPREQAAWLWDGLEPGFRIQEQPDRYQPGLLPDLYWSLLDGEQPMDRTAAWAAVEYVHLRFGWGGLGRVIRTLGAQCEIVDCSTPQGLDSAYRAALGMGVIEFSTAWQGFWSARLGAAVAQVQATLDQRAAAVAAGSVNRFLATVDPSVRSFIAEQREYFQRLQASTSGELGWGAEPRVLYPDGRVLARVGRVSPGAENPRPNSNWSEVLFTPSSAGLRWAGYPLELLAQDGLAVLYPAGEEPLATNLFDLAEAARRALEAVLDLPAAQRTTLKIYPDAAALRNSIPLDPAIDVGGVQASPASIKMLGLGADEPVPDELRAEVVQAMIRSVLEGSGLQSEWLLRGLGLYLVPELDQRARMFQASRYLPRIPSAALRDSLPALTAMQGDQALEPDGRELANAQAWDAVRLLFDRFGDGVLADLLQRVRKGESFAAAFEAATGMSEAAYADFWLGESLQADLNANLVAIAGTFEAGSALAHVDELTRPAYGGRAAGTAGAAAAAEYIRSRFEQYGLQPVVPQEPVAVDGAGEQSPEGEPPAADAEQEPPAPGYEQAFDIFSVPLERAPALQVWMTDTLEVFSLRYRYDFIQIPQAYAYAGPVRGELIWIRAGEAFPDIDLTGKIVVRFKPASPEEELQLAVERGAAGLILVTEDQAVYPFLDKQPQPVGEPAQVPIPVFEMRQVAYQRLMTAAGETPVSLEQGPDVVRLGMQVEMDLPTLPPRRVPAANILGLLPGTNPDLADEVVILAAHYDYVGDDPDAWRCSPGIPPVEAAIRLGLCRFEPGLRYSGANDDAAGIAALLEIARSWQQAGYRPERSVLFAAWGAQEPGQVGSEFYVEHPLFALDSTVAVIQLDEIAGGRGYYLEVHGTTEHDGRLIGLANLLEDTAQARISLMRERLVEPDEEARRPLPWLSSSTTSDGVVSDHLPFRQQNVPAALLTWRGSLQANEPDGEADAVQPERLAMAGRMAALMAMSLAR